MRQVLSVLMENAPGALSRLVGLFSQRGYNIESLNVAPTEDLTLSRLTLVTDGDARQLEQMTRQLDRLLDVYSVEAALEGGGDFLERELMLVKLELDTDSEEAVAVLEDAAAAVGAAVVAAGEGNRILELAATPERLDQFLHDLKARQLTVLEVVRGGALSLRLDAPSGSGGVF